MCVGCSCAPCRPAFFPTCLSVRLSFPCRGRYCCQCEHHVATLTTHDPPNQVFDLLLILATRAHDQKQLQRNFHMDAATEQLVDAVWGCMASALDSMNYIDEAYTQLLQPHTQTLQLHEVGWSRLAWRCCLSSAVAFVVVAAAVGFCTSVGGGGGASSTLLMQRHYSSRPPHPTQAHRRTDTNSHTDILIQSHTHLCESLQTR